MRYLTAIGCRGGLATLLLGALLATGCGAGPMARLAEFRRDRAVEKAIDEDPFPTAAEAGLVASDGHTHLD
jgi:hypothetical protein